MNKTTLICIHSESSHLNSINMTGFGTNCWSSVQWLIRFIMTKDPACRLVKQRSCTLDGWMRMKITRYCSSVIAAGVGGETVSSQISICFFFFWETKNEGELAKLVMHVMCTTSLSKQRGSTLSHLHARSWYISIYPENQSKFNLIFLSFLSFNP